MRRALAWALAAAAAVSSAVSSAIALTPGAELSPLPSAFRLEDRTEYTSLQEALRNGQLDFAERHEIELPAPIAPLIDAFRHVLEGRNTEALPLFDRIAAESEDPALAGLAQAAAVQIRYGSGDYAAVAGALGEPEDDSARLMHILAELPAESLHAADPLSDRLTVGPEGHPGADVRVNGHAETWWLDTGAALSVVARSVADSLGVTLTDDEPIETSTATTLTVSSRVGVIDSLRLGDVELRNHPVLVFPDDALRFELDSGDSLFVRGIVGWPALCQLRVEMDFVTRQVSARLPETLAPPVRNFSWLGYPIVRLGAGDGQPLLFGVDTGSRNTSIAENIYRKLTFGAVRDSTVRIGGAGGTVEIETKIVDRLTLALPEVLATLHDVRTESTSGANDVFFLAADGVIGADICRHGRLILDYPNGYLGVELPPE